MNENRRITILLASVLSLAACSSGRAQQPQKLSSFDLAKVHDMLHAAYMDVQKQYYDPKFHGIDIEARYREVDARLKTVGSLNEGMRLVAAYLDAFNDSHLFFEPPMRPYSIDSGFHMQMVGDQCLITAVRPQSDAADKLHPGDRVVRYNSFTVARADIWNLEYYFKVLSPQSGYDLNIQSPESAPRRVSVKAQIRQRPHTIDLTNPGSEYWDIIRRSENEDHASRSILKVVGDVTIWKMPEFNLDINDVEGTFARVKKHSGLVLDLRGNPGGAVETLTLMLSSVFDHDVKVADRVGRKPLTPIVAKKLRPPFAGKIIVLIDAGSASAAELFARTMQLEHRGTVVGDNSSGSVMESRTYSESTGGDTMVAFAFSITDANLIMSDGKSLEKIGVTPDEILLPTAKDLADGLDPVLSHAVTLAGASISPADAGKMFPIEWLSLK